MSARKTVVISMLGITLDRGKGAARWERWRPTVALCSHEDLVVDRLELLHQPKFSKLASEITADIRAVSPETEVRSHATAFRDAWDFEQVYGALHDFARAYPFAPEEEDYLVHMTTGTHVAQICLYLLAETHFIPGKLLQTAPPRRGDTGPGEFTIIDLDLSRYDKIATRFAEQQREDLSMLKAGIETRNEAFNRLIGRIEQVAVASSAPMLITGPTGVGKSKLARRIYQLKKSRYQVEGALVEVNCATLRGDSAMSTLFGHVKGAFTGAVQARTGLLRSAHGGLLFLDEIAELGLDEQAMLLRAIEEKVFLPVGSDREATSDFQLLAGTNRDLARRVADGLFREDLLARINLWSFELPPLRDRPEDVEPNLDHELRRLTEATGRKVTINTEARRRFLAFATREARWPGNFRDFNGALERMCTLAPGGRITLAQVAEELERQRAAPAQVTEALEQQGTIPELATGPLATRRRWAGGDEVLEEFLDTAAMEELDPFDRPQLAEVLSTCRGARSLSEAGRRLFAVSRAKKKSRNDADRLRKYLARFGLSWGDFTAR